MMTMLCSVSAYYDEKEKAWIATVTSDLADCPYRLYKIDACDEFVEAIAIMEMHGLDSIGILDRPDWSVKDIT